VSSIEGKHVVVELGTPVQTEPLACAITLAQAIPKGKNKDLIVQKAVELGAARIAPLLSERTVVQLEGEDASKRRVRLQEIALEACKQCGQNCLPEILEPATPARFLESHGKADVMLLGSLQPDARRIKTVLSDFLDATGHAPRTATVLIGPEGDFTPSEAAMARSAGCLPITLGPIILRSETAAIYCLSVLGHELY
jgi:16S rRNA (uracil1498-N3)-methyltransferase